jgi:hypothetical protein
MGTPPIKRVSGTVRSGTARVGTGDSPVLSAPPELSQNFFTSLILPAPQNKTPAKAGAKF